MFVAITGRHYLVQTMGNDHQEHKFSKPKFCHLRILNRQEALFNLNYELRLSLLKSGIFGNADGLTVRKQKRSGFF
jgi:hypothetical protein